MKFLDRLLRDWRIKMIRPYVRPNDKILDIGCYDATLFNELADKPIGESIGIDPLLKEPIEKANYSLISGRFPDNLPKGKTFNCVTMLAVLEHIPKEDQSRLDKEIYAYLEPKGRIIITVPSPYVDNILWVLSKLRLIDGMSLEEHYGFKAKDTVNLFSPKRFKLLKHKTFQLGLNHLFVFEKID